MIKMYESPLALLTWMIIKMNSNYTALLFMLSIMEARGRSLTDKFCQCGEKLIAHK